MNKLKLKLIIILTLFVIIIGLGSWMVLIHFFPELAFADYPLIPVYFYVVGLISISLLSRVNYDNSMKLLNKLMLIRGFKILITMLLGLVYWILDRSEIRSFAIMLAAFYLFYLFFEIYIFAQIEKWHRNNIDREPKLKDGEE